MNHPNFYRKEPPRLPSKDQLIMGIHAVYEVLRHAPDRLLSIYLEEPSTGGRKGDLFQLCEQHKIPIVFTSFERLGKMTGSDSHQSVAAHIKSRTFLNVKQLLGKLEGKKTSLLLMADQIFDPQNFGSLIRSAECLGADAIIWSKNRGTDITPSVAKASCGASEILPLVRISNLAEAVREFQEGGFEVVVSLLEPDAQDAFSFRFPAKTLLVVGSEGDGIQPLICKRADHAVYIPMAGKIASLNVSQAATALMTLYQAK